MPDNNPSINELRQDGIVPDDDIVARFRVGNIEFAEDGNGTVHIASCNDQPPRERIAAISPRDRDKLRDFLLRG